MWYNRAIEKATARDAEDTHARPDHNERVSFVMADTSILEKVCKKCGQTKPLTDFHAHPGTKDGHLSTCKVCKNIQQKQYAVVPREISGNPGEMLAADRMQALGIFAITGKMSRWIKQDLVAWGCVRIEVKKSREFGGKFIFKFDNQARKDNGAHLVILICDPIDGEPTFHVFPATHPVFYRTGSKRGSKVSPTGRKTGVEYNPQATCRKNTYGVPLTPALMEAHQDKWELVEEMRVLISQRLLAGTYNEGKTA